MILNMDYLQMEFIFADPVYDVHVDLSILLGTFKHTCGFHDLSFKLH